VNGNKSLSTRRALKRRPTAAAVAVSVSVAAVAVESETDFPRLERITTETDH